MKSIWYSEHEQPWNALLKRYWSLVKDENVQVELTLSRLRPADIASMNAEQWYNFLFAQYFVWKYSAKNRLATTRNKLKTYFENHELAELDEIRLKIVSLNLNSIASCLQTATQIRGLGVAGASGLLSLIYPEKFATVDQFVVKALLEVDDHRDEVNHMNPEGLSISDGVILTQILRAKASAMNASFSSTFGTPRTVEMALWAYRSNA